VIIRNRGFLPHYEKDQSPYEKRRLDYLYLERVEKYLDSGKDHPSIKEMLSHETGGLEARAPSSED
jgi:hypothetical protein